MLTKIYKIAEIGVYNRFELVIAIPSTIPTFYIPNTPGFNITTIV
jgi:hypothetical protein